MGDAVLERIATRLREAQLTDEALEAAVAPITRLIMEVPPGRPIVISMRNEQFDPLRYAFWQWVVRNDIRVDIEPEDLIHQRFTITGLRRSKRARMADSVPEVVVDAPHGTAVETPLAFPHRALTVEETAVLEAIGWMSPESQTASRNEVCAVIDRMQGHLDAYASFCYPNRVARRH